MNAYKDGPQQKVFYHFREVRGRKFIAEGRSLEDAKHQCRISIALRVCPTLDDLMKIMKIRKGKLWT